MGSCGSQKKGKNFGEKNPREFLFPQQKVKKRKRVKAGVEKTSAKSISFKVHTTAKLWK